MVGATKAALLVIHVPKPGRPGAGAQAGSLLGEISTVADTGWPDRVHAVFVILMVKASPAGAT
jgi:hypothetical protein